MQFTIGQAVKIKATERDEGGKGTVTRIKTDENRAQRKLVLLRVDIKGNPKQDAARKKKGKKHQGFWYDAAVAS